jgi:hypothetical protein
LTDLFRLILDTRVTDEVDLTGEVVKASVVGKRAELVKRYSKSEYQGQRLRRMVELAEECAKMPVRAPAPLPHTHQLERRLTAEIIIELVQAYRDGASTPELRQRYELGQRLSSSFCMSVVSRCGTKDLADDQVPVAAELYGIGMTLHSLASNSGSRRMPYGEYWFRQVVIHEDRQPRDASTWSSQSSQ